MTRSRKKIPSISFCPQRQKKWKNEQRHATRKRLHEFVDKFNDDDWFEPYAPTMKFYSNLYNSPSDQAKGDSAMFPLHQWFKPDQLTISDSWYRFCVRK